MKKILALPFLAIATMVSQTWAAYTVCEGQYAGYCLWTGEPCSAIAIDPGASWSKATCEEAYNNCKNNGAMYSDATCTQAVGTPPIACNYDCNWGAGGCWPIKTDPTGANGAITTTCEAAIAACDKDGVRYSSSDGTCTGSVSGGIQSCNQWCKWPAPTGCIEIKPDPTGQYNDGVPVPDCATAISNCSANGSLFDTQAACNSSTSVNNIPAGQPLMAAPFGRSLHIFSPRGATISLYDMSGAKVYSGKVPEGDRVFGLEKLASGSYYAIVQAGSDSKKIPVILK